MLSSQTEFQNLLLLHGRDRRFYKLKKELELIPPEQNRLQDQIGVEKLSIEIAHNEWRELETKNNENKVFGRLKKNLRFFNNLKNHF